MNNNAGVIFAIIGIGLALIFGIWGIYLSYRELKELNDVSRGIKYLADGIENLARGALKAIEKDGAETRQAIVDVHKSIKEELGK
jgi:hypothetical protein